MEQGVSSNSIENNPQNAGQVPEREQHGYGKVLRNSKFLRLWLGQAISNFGDALTRIALVILITEKTHAAGPISIVMIVQMIPMLFLGPFIGVLVDRWNRKRMMLTADLLRAVIIAGVLFAPNLVTIYILSFLSATVGLFFMPARSVVVVEIVGKADMMSAVSLSQMTYQTITIFGPMIGGALVGMLGTWIGFTVDAISFVGSALFTLSVAFPALPVASEKISVKAFFRDFADGMRFIWQAKVVRFLIVGFWVFMMAGGIINVLEINYWRNILHIGASQLGSLEMVMAVGALITATFLGQFATTWPKGRMIVTALLLVGMISIFYYFRPGYYVLLLMMFLFGIADATLNIPISTLTITLVPVAMRGRVSSAINSLFNMTTVLGMALAAPASALVGTTGALSLAGVILIFAAVASPFFPAYRLLNTGETPNSSEGHTSELQDKVIQA